MLRCATWENKGLFICCFENSAPCSILHRAARRGPEAQPASCAVDTGYFLRVKQPERGADHSRPYSAGLRMCRIYTSAKHPPPPSLLWLSKRIMG